MTEDLSFTHAVLAGALGSAVVALAAVLGARLLTRRPTGVEAVGAAVAISGLAAVAQLALVGDGFGRLHVAYLWVFVTLPVVGGAVLVLSLLPPLRLRRSGVVAAAALLALAIVGLYATHVEPRWLRVDRAELDVAAVGEGEEPIRIGVLADLQTDGFDGHEERAVDRLLAEEPDLILLAGDYFQSDGPDFFASLPELRALLARIEAPAGVFLVEGDIDSPERMAFMTEGIDALRWLDEEVVTTEVRGQAIRIGGISVRYDSPVARATIDELVSGGAPDEVRLLLSHRPDAAFDVPPGGVDLVVSGHTHGGQVQLPFFGPPIKLSDVSRAVAAGGLHEVDGVPIYLSTGVGMERATAPQVRFLARPSIGVVTLR